MPLILEPHIDRLLSPSDQPKATVLRWIFAIVVSSILSLVLLATLVVAVNVVGPAIGIDISSYFPDEISEESWATINDLVTFGILALYVPAFILAVRITGVKIADLVNPWRTGISYRRIGAAILITVVAYMILLIPSMFTPGALAFRPWTAQVFWLALAYGFLILFQAAGEELICRGALIHLIGKTTKNVWVLLLIPTLVFWLLHGGNVENEYVDPLYLNGFYILMGLALGGLVLLTGRLEYSIGLHIGNNLFVAILTDNISNPELSNGVGFITIGTASTPLDLMVNALTVLVLAYILLRYDRSLKAEEVASLATS